MDTIDSAKQIISIYYPRDHLIAVGFLSFLLLVTLALPRPETNSTRFIKIQLPLNPTNDIPLANNLVEIEFPPMQTVQTITPIAEESANNINEIDQYSPWTELEVKSGDTLSDLFQQVGLNAQDVYKVVNSSSAASVLNRLYPGYRLIFKILESGELDQLEVIMSAVSGFLFTLQDGSYELEQYQRTPDIYTTFKQGALSNELHNLTKAGRQADIPLSTLIKMANIFGGVIDFILDPRIDDDFSILYEEKYLNGDFIGNGEIIAAQYTNQGKQYIALRYEDINGNVGFYSPEGVSMRKTFLRSPLDVFRISSNFNLRRKHPVLNTIRAHRGTDYAAPRGTPVIATSDGRVIWSARNGSFGNLIVIQHTGEFQTKYAHLNAYGKGIKKGVRVKQGQIIGYVGATGRVTGPHLHYEFLMNGTHRNPRTILDKLPKARAIESGEMHRFLASTQDMHARFKITP